ncbi:MAG: S8 family serine peptidase, partial [Firmicutes bacterium]|nr:S8 family serine peptidase [Bacillota bacterium]
MKRLSPVWVLFLAVLLALGGLLLSSLFGASDPGHEVVVEIPDDPLGFQPLELERGTVTDPVTGLEFVTGEVLIVTHEGVFHQQVARIVSELTDGEVSGGSEEFGLFQVRLPGDDARAVLEAVAALESVPEFKAVMPNLIPGFPGEVVVPEEPQWKGEDDKKRWGQVYIDLPAAWALTKGGPELKIGVVDSGFDLHHPDLNITRLVEVDGKPWSTKDLFHGTYVASIIGASPHNKWGMSGVVWETQLHCYQISSFRDVVSAIILAAKEGMAVLHSS